MQVSVLITFQFRYHNKPCHGNWQEFTKGQGIYYNTFGFKNLPSLLLYSGNCGKEDRQIYECMHVYGAKHSDRQILNSVNTN